MAEILYSIETNAVYERHPIGVAHIPEKVLLAFGMAKLVSVDIVKKPNKNSSLYRVCCDNGIFILRSAPLYQRYIIELQCSIISSLVTQDFIDPIASTNTKFVVESEKLGWIAYPELKGEIFDGQNCNIEFILQEVFINPKILMIKN